MLLIGHYIGHRDFERGKGSPSSNAQPADAGTIVVELSTDPPDDLARDLGARVRQLLTDGEWERLHELVEQVISGEFEAERRAAREREVRDAAVREMEESKARERTEAAIAAREAAEREARERMSALARRALADSFLTAEATLGHTPGLEGLSAADWADLRAEFVRDWAKRELKMDLDAEQASAVGAVAPAVKLIARAGSGKTRVLTARALFLQMQCDVDPSEILLLAFNKKAAEEMRTRILEHASATPHAMTFHALAHAIVKPEENLIYDDVDRGLLKYSKTMQRAIDDLVETPNGLAVLRRTMDRYFRSDLESLLARGQHLGPSDGLAFRRGLLQETLKGDQVRSFGEKHIANALFENDVGYSYERAHWWKDGTPYRPDFTIHGHKVVIEYFGMTGKEEYDRSTAAKITYWRSRRDWKLIELYPSDLFTSSGAPSATRLLERLHAAGVPSRSLSDEEVWAKCKDRAIFRFTEAMGNVLGRARAEGIGVSDLRDRGHAMANLIDREFVDAACSVLEAYEATCKRDSLEDFSGLIWRAVDAVRGGQTRFVRDKGKEVGDLRNIQFLLVDELQDLTPGFHELLSAITAQAPAATVFGVGDDWQAITRYAGADPDLFTQLPGPIAAGERMHLSTNYRSRPAIVNAGNRLMDGRGKPAEAANDGPGGIAVIYTDGLELSVVERSVFGHDSLTPALLRIVADRTTQGHSVTLLARNNNLPYSAATEEIELDRYLEYIQCFLSHEQRRLVNAATIHRFKGREADVVVIIDGVRGRHPFLHPEWFFSRVLDDSEARIEDDERRLFYVGITRGRQETLVMSERHNRSDFLDLIAADTTDATARTNRLPVPNSIVEGREMLVVHDGYHIKDALKVLGFRWSPTDGAWWFIGSTSDIARVAEDPILRELRYAIERKPAGSPMGRGRG